MKKKIASLLLALVMCLSLLPLPVSAAGANLPDWYFLFAIFKNVDADGKDKNGKAVHTKYSMTQDEIDYAKAEAKDFETYMSQVGVMRAHVEIVEIDQPVTKLYNGSKLGSYLRAEEASPLLEGKVDLDRYDHVACYVSLNDLIVSWLGVTSTTFENGTGMSCINLKNREDCLSYLCPRYEEFPSAVSVHEFLHFMESMVKKWGAEFDQHGIEGNFYPNNAWKPCSTDIILNQVKGTAETGTGVHPAAWQYPPHVLRTMTELNIPSGVTRVGDSAFRFNAALTKVTIPSSVTSIEKWAFQNCGALAEVKLSSGLVTIGPAAFELTALTELTIPSGVTSIGIWAFQGCEALVRVSIPASVTSIGEVAFQKTVLKDVYYAGTEEQWKAIQIGEYNGALTNANIHYNHLMADVKTTDWFAQPVMWAVEKGITAGTGGGAFSPNATCTQGQILTFLWRAYGSPETSGKANGSEYYAVPLQWAKERGVTGGSLDPNSPCTRADVVTYLWKLAGSPSAKAASFSDVPASAGYAGAVSWAVEQGVTSGTSAATFSPNSACTRGQIVTFLRQALAK